MKNKKIGRPKGSVKRKGWTKVAPQISPEAVTYLNKLKAQGHKKNDIINRAILNYNPEA